MARRARILRYFSYALLAGAVALIAFALYLDYRVRDEFEGRRFALPARIYARPLELHAGLRVPPSAVEQELRDLGYREAPREDESGWFVRTGEGLEIALRPFVFWDGPQEAKRLRGAFDGMTVSSLRDRQGAEVTLARLEPLLIGGIYPRSEERRVGKECR